MKIYALLRVCKQCFDSRLLGSAKLLSESTTGSLVVFLFHAKARKS